MPPRIAAAAKAVAAAAEERRPESLEDVIRVLNKLSDQFTDFNKKLGSVDDMKSHITSLEKKFEALEAKLIIQLDENKQLRAENAAKSKDIEDMQANNSYLEFKCNELEQYNRSWSIRIHNVPLTAEEEKSPTKTRDKVYALALLPILEGAKSRGDIDAVPEAEQLLEIAHVLAGKPGEPKPVIARFYNRADKALCLRLKRDFAPRKARPTQQGRDGTSDGASGRTEERGWYVHPFNEDLTRINFAKMRSISKDPAVQSCWSINGSLRFRLVDSSVVKRVSNVFDPIAKIIAK